MPGEPLDILIHLEPDMADRLRLAAEKRNVGALNLAVDLFVTMIEDKMIDAVIDDGITTGV